MSREALEPLYHLVGDQVFTYPQIRGKGIISLAHLRRLVNDGYVIRYRTAGAAMQYQIAARYLKQIRSAHILDDPQTVIDLLEHTVSFRALAVETGYSVETLKNKLFEEIYARYQGKEITTPSPSP